MSNTKKNSLRPSARGEQILTVLIILQFMMICIVNLTQLRALIGYDSSSGYLMVNKIVEQRSLVLKDWAYQTTMGWDSPVLGAAFFCAFLHDPFLSFGLSNILSVAVMVILFTLLLREMNISGIASRLAVVMLLTPYTAAYSGENALDYLSMTCINMGSYSYRIIFLFALAIVYLRFQRDFPKAKAPVSTKKGKTTKQPAASFVVSKSTIVIAVFASALAFIIGICTGISMIILLVAPFLLHGGILFLVRNDSRELKAPSFLFACAQAVLIFIGKLFSTHVLHFVGRAESIEWIPAEKFFSNIGGLFSGYFGLTYALPLKSQVTITTKLGIAFGVMLCIALFLLVCSIVVMVRTIRSKDLGGPVFLFTILILLNTFVLLFSNSSYSSEGTEPRYFIYILISFMLLTCHLLRDFHPNAKVLVQKYFIPVVVLCFMFSNFMFYYSAYHHRVNLQRYENITYQIGLTKAPVVYTYGDDILFDSRVLRALDPNGVIYHQIASDFSGIDVWGDTTEKMTADQWSGTVAYLMTPENYKKMPPYVAATFTSVIQVEDYYLCTADTNVITNEYLASPNKDEFIVVVDEPVTVNSESV